MAFDYDYPESFDHDKTCDNCGALIDDRSDECLNCREQFETSDPDELHDSKIDRE